MRLLLRCLIFCCWLDADVVLAAGPELPKVAVVSSEASGAHAQASQALINALEQSGLPGTSIAWMSAQDLTQRAKDGQLDSLRVFVGVGVQATQALLASPDVSAPVLSILIPRRSFAQLVRSAGRKTTAQISALYLDQPLHRQLALIKLALPQTQQVGVLLGPDSVGKLPELQALVHERKMTLRSASVADDPTLFAALRTVLDGSDVLLALADPGVFNSDSVQNILLASFRAHVPMVAFSPAYTRAGAVLSLYSSPQQVGSQAAGLVLTALRGGRLPEAPVEPDDFLVDVNANVAHSLGFTLDAQKLRQALRRRELAP